MEEMNPLVDLKYSPIPEEEEIREYKAQTTAFESSRKEKDEELNSFIVKNVKSKFTQILKTFGCELRLCGLFMEICIS